VSLFDALPVPAELYRDVHQRPKFCIVVSDLSRPRRRRCSV